MPEGSKGVRIVVCAGIWSRPHDLLVVFGRALANHVHTAMRQWEPPYRDIQRTRAEDMLCAKHEGGE